MDFIEISNEIFYCDEIISKISHFTCSGIGIFIGTPKDSLEGRKVAHVFYEAYDEMAKKQIKKICVNARKKFNIKHIAIYHRVGHIGVSEPSVGVAVSSVHSREALEAVFFLTNSVKAIVPIWRKEIYDGDIGEWKYNKECFWIKDKVGDPTSSAIHEDVNGHFTIQSKKMKHFSGITELSHGNETDVRSALVIFEQSIASSIGNLQKTLSSADYNYQESLARSKALEEEIKKMTKKNNDLQYEIRNLNQLYNDLQDESEGQKTNTGLLSERLLSMKSTHREELASIAKKQKKDYIARRFFNLWKNRALNGPNSKRHSLELEIKFLRNELFTTQEAAKKAFLRSAKNINSEALNLFNDAATRRVGPFLHENNIDDDHSNHYNKIHHNKGKYREKRFISEDSDISQKEGDCFSGKRNKVDKYTIQSTKENFIIDEDPRCSRKVNYDGDRNFNTCARGKSSLDSNLLQKRTRDIMGSLKQIERNIPESSNSSSSSLDYQCNYPTSSFNPVIGTKRCFCKDNIDKTTLSCQFCKPFPHSEYPVNRGKGARTKSFTLNSRKQAKPIKKNITFASTNDEVVKEKVIYQPSGSMVVIEKHLK